MKITGSGPGSPEKLNGTSGSSAAGALGAAKEKRGNTRLDKAETGISDKVAISGRAKEAAKAMEIARSAPEADEARIAKLKAAIQNGSYKVDADAVADRLVDEHLATAF